MVFEAKRKSSDSCGQFIEIWTSRLHFRILHHLATFGGSCAPPTTKTTRRTGNRAHKTHVFKKKYCFRCSETHSLIGKIWPNLGAQIWPNSRFVWVFDKMCKTLFHPLLEQAFQRRDSFLLEATVSIDISPLPALDIQEKIFAV